MGALTSRRIVAFVLIVVACLVPSRALAQSETTEYYGLDTTGSVRVVFDASGSVLSRVDYGPFGEQLAAAPGAPNEKYAGLFRDDETGLDYAQARQYNPRSGRFTSLDPVYSGLFEPQRWNRYAYALNSPLTFVDPEGLQASTGIPGFCSAENSYGRCGGDPLFWDTSGGGGFAFGDGYVHAQNLGYVPGMPANVWADLLSFQVRAETAFTESREAAQSNGSATTSTSERYRVEADGKTTYLDGANALDALHDAGGIAGPMAQPTSYAWLIGGPAVIAAITSTPLGTTFLTYMFSLASTPGAVAAARSFIEGTMPTPPPPNLPGYAGTVFYTIFGEKIEKTVVPWVLEHSPHRGNK